MGATAGLNGDGSEAEGTFLGGGLSRGSLLFPLQAIDALDHQENGKGYNDKADDGVDEGSPVKNHGSRRLGYS